jgi:hypothetical protein
MLSHWTRHLWNVKWRFIRSFQHLGLYSVECSIRKEFEMKRSWSDRGTLPALPLSD